MAVRSCLCVCPSRLPSQCRQSREERSSSSSSAASTVLRRAQHRLADLEAGESSRLDQVLRGTLFDAEKVAIALAP